MGKSASAVKTKDKVEKSDTSSEKAVTGQGLIPQIVDLGITYKHITIDPKEAARITAAAEHATEKLIPTVVDHRARETYATSMKNDAWLLNANPIVFDEQGRLLDGYHRLLATIEAGKPLRTLVAHGAKADTLHTIDQHRRRTFIGILEARGIKNAGDVHRSLSKLIRIENGTFIKSNQSAAWPRLDIVLGANPEIQEASEFARSFAKDILIPHNARTPFCFMAIRAGHREELERFILDMLDEDLPATNPARMLHLNFESIVENTALRTVDADIGLGLCIKAFTEYVAGEKSRKTYSWKPDFGDADLNTMGRPISMKAARESAPPNCGLPMIPGYPGLRKGKMGTSEEEAQLFDGDYTSGMRKAAKSTHDEPLVISVLVTPEIAKYWLDNYNTVNRSIQKSHVERIARDIRSGNWMVNAQPIAFNGDPTHPDDGPVRLLNGQHRLQACVEAKTPIEVPIAIGVNQDAFATFDIHAKKSKSVHSGDDRVARAAAVFQWREDMKLKLQDKQRPSATEIEFTLRNHPELSRFVGQIRHLDPEAKNRYDQIASGSVIAYFLYRIHRENEVFARDFAEKMRSRMEIERGNPIAKMLTQLSHQRQSGAQKMNRYQTLNFLLSTWEAYKAWRKNPNSKAAQTIAMETDGEGGEDPQSELAV